MQRHNTTSAKVARLESAAPSLAVPDSELREMLGGISRTHLWRLRKSDPRFPARLPGLSTRRRTLTSRAAAEAYVAALNGAAQ